MGIFSASYRRAGGEVAKEEDKIIKKIHNDKTLGSENIFTTGQIALFNNIIKAADNFFETCYPESKKYDLTEICAEVPIYLIPYDKYIMRMKDWCSSDFAKKMRAKFRKEMDSMPQDEESEKRKKKIRKKYGPWLCPCASSACSGCTRAWTTPLGYYDPKNNEIFICLDRIISSYPDNVDAIAAMVMLHELGHALMNKPKSDIYDSLFGYWAEESLANKIALKYMTAASCLLKQPTLFIEAKNMVQHQPAEYELGLYLFDKNAADWNIFQENKPLFNDVMGERWVDAVCEDDCNKQFAEIQKYFYMTLDNIAPSLCSPVSPFESWLHSVIMTEVTIKRYFAIVSSEYIGRALQDIIGFRYMTISDCKSSYEIDNVIMQIRNHGSAAYQFNLATYGGLRPALGKYREFLISRGL